MRKSKHRIETFLGSQTTLEGQLRFEGTLRLDGHFLGSIQSAEGTMIVGEDAVIDADISVHRAVVSGEVKGNIHASNRIELHPPARVFGDLSAPEVIIDAGVVLRGNCSMGPKDGSAGKTVEVPTKV